MPKKHTDGFPGFSKCMAMLRNFKDPMTQEEGYHWLLPRAGEFVEPLLTELAAESDQHMHSWLLELLSDARSVRAYPAFAQYLDSPDESLRNWAERGLRQLGQTREGRIFLWDRYHAMTGTSAVAPVLPHAPKPRLQVLLNDILSEHR